MVRRRKRRCVILVAHHLIPERLLRDLSREVFGGSKVEGVVVEPPKDPDALLVIGFMRFLDSRISMCDEAVVAVSTLELDPIKAWAVEAVCETHGMHAYVAIMRKLEEGEKVSEDRVVKYGGERYYYQRVSDDWMIMMLVKEEIVSLNEGIKN